MGPTNKKPKANSSDAGQWFERGRCGKTAGDFSPRGGISY
jgi:hypothetical protein